MADEQGEKICIWSDGTWCDFSDLSGYSFMSDDFVITFAPFDCSIDDFVEGFLK